MTTLADARFEALRFAGYTGSTNDMLVQFFEAKVGAAGDSLNDLKLTWLQTALGKSGHITDLWYEYLGTQGHTQGSLNDRELAFWISQGPP